MLTFLLRTIKNEFFESQLRNNKDNAKLTWQIINNLIGRTNQSNNMPINLTDIPCSDAANTFNHHFIKTDDVCDHDPDVDFEHFLKNSSKASIHLTRS